MIASCVKILPPYMYLIIEGLYIYISRMNYIFLFGITAGTLLIISRKDDTYESINYIDVCVF